MRHWLQAGDALLDMFVGFAITNCCSKYRVQNLYSGPLDSPEAEAVRKCDPDGIVAMYVSKMVPTS
jgi:elongation factor 2